MEHGKKVVAWCYGSLTQLEKQKTQDLRGQIPRRKGTKEKLEVEEKKLKKKKLRNAKYWICGGIQ